MDFRTELASFLQSRRARVRPEDLGVRPLSGRRRVPGLRREELAERAGVSVDYYVRLEQGRSPNVSEQVLDSIARTLRLDASERAHLGHLTRALRGDSGAHPDPVTPQPVRGGVRILLDAVGDVPAYVLGRRLDVLASNRAARALFVDFDALPPAQRNLAWLHFHHPAMRELYTDWEEAARDTVAALRMDLGRFPCDDRLCALLAELSVGSAEFRHLWSEHQVREHAHDVQRLHHPVAGELTLNRETLSLPTEPDQSLVTLAAEPGTASQEALRTLVGDLATAVRMP
ncbi:helix-turn-helix domain-containing protein [Streptomyces formicae]